MSYVFQFAHGCGQVGAAQVRALRTGRHCVFVSLADALEQGGEGRYAYAARDEQSLAAVPRSRSQSAVRTVH